MVQASKATFEGCGTTIAILRADGSPLSPPQAICGGTGKLDAQRLPTSGSYTLLVDPDGATTGETTLTLSTVPA
jgi:large repetitive protein